MNYKTFLLLLITLSSLTVWSQNNVRIDGQIIGYDGSKEVLYGISPVYGPPHDKSIKPDSLGRFTIITSIKETMFFSLHYSQGGISHSCRLILKPDTYYSFVSEGFESKNWNKYYSPEIYSLRINPDEKNPYYSVDYGQIYYNKIDNGTMGSLYHDNWNLYHPDLLIDTLEARINAQKAVFQKLLDEGLIDNEFYKIAKMNVEYFNGYQLASTIYDTWQLLTKYGIDDTIIQNKLYKIYSEIFELYPVEGVAMEKLYGFDRYVDLYLLFLEDYKEGEFKPVIRKGPAVTKVRMKHAEEVLSPIAYRYYALRNTMSYTASLASGSAKAAEDFLLKNPEIKNSQSGNFLENILIPRAENFEQLSAEEFPEDIIILDKEKPVESFRELLDTMNGKPFLIDYWGTWCGPCLHQFRFNDSLKSFCEKNGIAMVYIAYEYDPDRQKWENFIKAFRLTGYHFISDDNFKTDFEKYSGKITRFPSYIIIDPKGNILESNAAYPSEGDKLFSQLKDKLKN
jgi:thiol-disulfide isomerase/thioredoxin